MPTISPASRCSIRRPGRWRSSAPSPARSLRRTACASGFGSGDTALRIGRQHVDPTRRHAIASTACRRTPIGSTRMPLPPAVQSGLGPGDIQLPLDVNGRPVAASGPTETLFYPGTRDPNAFLPIQVARAAVVASERPQRAEPPGCRDLRCVVIRLLRLAGGAAGVCKFHGFRGYYRSQWVRPHLAGTADDSRPGSTGAGRRRRQRAPDQHRNLLRGRRHLPGRVRVPDAVLRQPDRATSISRCPTTPTCCRTA